MSTAIYAVCLLVSVVGAEPSDRVSADNTVSAATEEVMSTDMPAVIISDPVGAPCVMRARYRRPEPLLYIDTSCSMRWYTLLNAGHHRRPYDYLVQFDYPWHPEPRCGRCVSGNKWAGLVLRPHASLAPLAPWNDTLEGGNTTSRPSAIRKVD